MARMPNDQSLLDKIRQRTNLDRLRAQTYKKPPAPGAGPAPTGPEATPRAPGQEGLRTPAQGLKARFPTAYGAAASVKNAAKFIGKTALGAAAYPLIAAASPAVKKVLGDVNPFDSNQAFAGTQTDAQHDRGFAAVQTGLRGTPAEREAARITRAGTTAERANISPARAKAPDTSAERMKANAATYAAGTGEPLGQIDTGLRTRIVQDGKNRFSDGTPRPPGIGKKGGGLSIVGSLTPERIASISQANADLQEAREAASIGISTEQYRRQKAKRATDSEIAGLTQNGLGLREATARVFDRNAAADVEAAKGVGGLDASDQIALMSLQQRIGNQDANLGLRRDQFGLNQEQVADQKAAADRSAVDKYTEGLNDENPAIQADTRARLVQKGMQNFDSPEGELLISQLNQSLRQREGDERGPIDAAISAKQGQPEFDVLGGFTLEEGYFGKGLTGTKIIGPDGQDWGNLQDQPPEFRQALLFLHDQMNPRTGIRR